MTFRTFAVAGDFVVADEVTGAFDEQFAAVRAKSIFPLANAARQVAGVNKTQSFLDADFRRADELARRSSRRVGDFVIGMKRRDVPRNVAADRGEEFRDGAQFVFAVVESGHDQRDDFQPQAAFVHHADAVAHVFQRAAERAIAFVVETFQVNFVGHDPRTQEIERFGRGVAVGDKGAGQPGRLRLLEDGHRPLGGDERFVVAGHDQSRTIPARRVRRPGPASIQRWALPARFVAHRLAGHPVLAIPAMKIAAEHPERERIAAGIDMEKRFLLDRIVGQSASHITEWHAEFTAFIEAHFADAASSRRDEATMTACDATHAVVFGVPEFAHDGLPVERVGEGPVDHR